MGAEAILIVFAVSFISSLVGVIMGRKFFFPEEFVVNITIHHEGENDGELLEKMKSKLEEVLGTKLNERE